MKKKETEHVVFNATYWREMFNEYNRRLSVLEKHISVEQFGTYVSFIQKPTDKDVEEAAIRMFADLLPGIKDRVVIQRHWPATEAGPEYWTVGIKIMVPGASADVEAG